MSYRVRELSEGYQQPEGRFGGELDSLPFVRCRLSQPAGETLFPRPVTFVQNLGLVEVGVLQPDLFATVLLCSGSNSASYNQNPGFILFACEDQDRFQEGEEILQFPKDCEVSEPVEVYRAR